MIKFNKQLAQLAKKNNLFYTYRLITDFALQTQDTGLITLAVDGKIFGQNIGHKAFINFLKDTKERYEKYSKENPNKVTR